MNLPMEAFCLRGYEGEKISLIINEVLGFPDSTSYEGGFDIICTLEIHSGNYHVVGKPYYSATGTLYRFSKELEKCYEKLAGVANYEMFLEKDLTFMVQMISRGHALVKGVYQECPGIQNILQFEFETDQTSFLSVIKSIKQIENILGNGEGVKGNKY